MSESGQSGPSILPNAIAQILGEIGLYEPIVCFKSSGGSSESKICKEHTLPQPRGGAAKVAVDGLSLPTRL